MHFYNVVDPRSELLVTAPSSSLADPGAGSATAPVSGRGRRIRRTEFWVYVFLLPTIVLYGLFTVYPIIAATGTRS